jgi:hypothetical protein
LQERLKEVSGKEGQESMGGIRGPKGVMVGGKKKARTDQAMGQKEDDWEDHNETNKRSW